ncbi:MAG TPA: transposase, partial [Chromatiaceae bacterium]|nr:transposase [Chromatiaceae bacterium]
MTQRGNRRQRIFMEDDDDMLYRDWLARRVDQTAW